MAGTHPRARTPQQFDVRLEMVRSEGQDAAILTAITALQKDLVRRLERLEKKIEALSLNQDTIDRLAARLKAANDQLTSDVNSSTP